MNVILSATDRMQAFTVELFLKGINSSVILHLYLEGIWSCDEQKAVLSSPTKHRHLYSKMLAMIDSVV